MTPGVRKFALTTHITLSVGWIGAVLAYLVLVVAAMTTADAQMLRSAWLAMESIGWYLIVPLALAALTTGVIMALATPWGLFRHYWVLISLVLTVLVTTVLLLHMPSVSVSARIAGGGDSADLGALRSALKSELLHAGLGLVVLVTVEALNVYKPRGVTAYGRRTSGQPLDVSSSREAARTELRPITAKRRRRVVQIVWIHAVALLLLFAIMHLAGGGLHHH